jgi:hypothetical protein
MPISLRIDAGDTLNKLERDLKAQLKHFGEQIAEAITKQPVEAVDQLAGALNGLEGLLKNALSVEKQLEKTTGAVFKELGSLKDAGLDELSPQIEETSAKLSQNEAAWKSLKAIVSETIALMKQGTSEIKQGAAGLPVQQQVAVTDRAAKSGAIVAKVEAQQQAQTSTVRSSFLEEAEKQRQQEANQLESQQAKAEAAERARVQAEIDAARKQREADEDAASKERIQADAAYEKERQAAKKQADAQNAADTKAITAFQSQQEKDRKAAIKAATKAVNEKRDQEEEAKRRDDDDINARARKRSFDAAYETRAASSELQRQEAARREIRDLQEKIRNSKELAAVDANAAAAADQMERQIQELTRVIDESGVAFTRARDRARGATREVGAIFSTRAADVTPETRQFVSRQVEERRKAEREINQRGQTAEARQGFANVVTAKNQNVDLNRSVSEAQDRAERALAYANTATTQHNQLSVQIADMKSYIKQLDAVKDKTAQQRLTLANWLAELERVQQQQQNLARTVEASVSTARQRTEEARTVLQGAVASGGLTAKQQEQAIGRQATQDLRQTHLEMKELKVESRAAAENLGLVGRFLNAISTNGKTAQKVVIDLAQAYLINTRAGNEAFNAAQRAEKLFSGTRFGTAATVGVVGVIGAIATYQAAAKAEDLRQKTLKEAAAGGDKKAQAELKEFEGRALASAGASRALSEAIFKGKDNLSVFGTAVRSLSGLMRSSTENWQDFKLALSGDINLFDRSTIAVGRLNAELRERRALIQQQAYQTRIETRGRLGSASVGSIRDEDVYRAEYARLTKEMATTKDGKYLTEVLGPRLVALEGQIVAVRQTQLERAKAITSEVAKNISSASQLRQNIEELKTFLKTASGSEADEALQSLATYKDRLHDLELQLVSMREANRAAWQDVPKTLSLRQVSQATGRDQFGAITQQAESQEAAAKQRAESAQRRSLKYGKVGQEGFADYSAEEDERLKRKAQAAQTEYDLAKRARQETEYAVQAKERELLSRKADFEAERRNSAVQQPVDIYRARLATQREMNDLLEEEERIRETIDSATPGTDQELQAQQALSAVKQRQRQLELEAVEREVAAERMLFDLAIRRRVVSQEQIRDQERLFSQVGMAEAAGRGMGSRADGNAASIEQARRDRIAELEGRRPALDTKLQDAAAAGSGVSAEEIQQLQAEVQAVEGEIQQLQGAIAQDAARRAQEAVQKAQQIRTLAMGVNNPLRAEQFDLAERKLAMFAANENLSIERRKASLRLQADMQKSLDDSADAAKDLAAKIKDLEAAGRGATDEAVKLRQEMEKQLQLSTDIAQRQKQIADAEREAALAARQKEQEKRNEAFGKAVEGLRSQGRMDPLTALGQRITGRQIQNQVQEDRKARFEELRGELGDAEARRRVFGRPVGQEEQLNAKQRIGQAAIDNLEKRGLISEEMATQLREQLSAEANKLRETIRLTEATQNLTAAINQVGRLPVNQGPQKGANPNQQKGLLDPEKPLNAQQQKALADKKAADERRADVSEKQKVVNEKRRQDFLQSEAGQKWIKEREERQDKAAWMSQLEVDGVIRPDEIPGAGAMRALRRQEERRQRQQESAKPSGSDMPADFSGTPGAGQNTQASFMQGLIKMAQELAQSQAKLAEDSQRVNQFLEALSQQVASLTDSTLKANEGARSRAAKSFQNV